LNTYPSIKNILNNPFSLSCRISFLFFVIGTIGILLNVEFAQLTPFHLLLNFALFIYSFEQRNNLFYVQVLLLFFAGYSLEVIGVKSGLLFGNYTYLENLGPKLLETPILIGVNWVLVSFSSISVVEWFAQKFKIKLNQLIASILGGLLMVLTDVFIEPIAPILGFWEWDGGIIPLQNYTAWFFFGFVFCYWIVQQQLHNKSKYATFLYLLQLLFFVSLNL
jgi:putative membrane protein